MIFNIVVNTNFTFQGFGQEWLLSIFCNFGACLGNTALKAYIKNSKQKNAEVIT